MSELVSKVEIIDDGSGIEMPAYQFKCQCSNIAPDEEGVVESDVFYMFWDHRHDPQHLHIQCYDCEQMYCPLGLCIPPPTAEVIGT